MIRSMTGYGRAALSVDSLNVTVEIKSVNHRYFEFTSRIPRQYGFLDEKLKSYINSRVARGKVECCVTIEALDTDSAEVLINKTLASAYVSALKEIADEYNLKEDFGATAISRFQDVLVVKKADEDADRIWGFVKEVANEAIDKLTAVGLNSVPSWVRPYEVLSTGEKFRADLSRRLKDNAVIDEFTSVVDRNVAKSCCVSISKYIIRPTSPKLAIKSVIAKSVVASGK